MMMSKLQWGVFLSFALLAGCESGTSNQTSKDAGSEGKQFFFTESGASIPLEGGLRRDGQPPYTDAGALAPLKVPGKSGSRLRRVFWRAGETEGLDNKLFDSQLQTFCYWEKMPDGTARCLPSGDAPPATGGFQFNGVAFTDSQCKNAITPVTAAIAAQWQTCGTESFYYSIFDDIPGAACSAEELDHIVGGLTCHELFHITGRANMSGVTKTYYLDGNTMQCLPQGIDPYAVFYQIQRLDWSTFPQATFKTGAKGSTYLEERILTTSDGLELPMPFFDTQHNGLCALMPQADHQQHCLPTVNALNWRSDLFTSAQCSGALAVLGTLDNCAVPRFVRKDSSCQADEVSVFTLGQPLTSEYILNPDGVTCVSVSQDIFHFYQLGAVIDPGQFVQGVLAPHGAPGRIAPWVEHADGLTHLGLLSSKGFWDNQTQTICYPLTASDGVKRCLPGSSTLTYLDAQCQGPQYVIFPCAKVTQKTTAIYHYPAGQSCMNKSPVTFQVMNVGTQVTPTPSSYYIGDGTTNCIKIDMRAGQVIYALGAEQPPTDFAEVIQAVE
jgi:hypothetical protein